MKNRIEFDKRLKREVRRAWAHPVPSIIMYIALSVGITLLGMAVASIHGWACP